MVQTPADKNAYWRAWYARKPRPEYSRRSSSRNKQIRANVSAAINEYKARHGCADCGEADPIVLDFDHVGTDKEYSISDMVRAALSLDTIMREIAKCEVCCANCHRRRTYNRVQGVAQ